MADFGPNSLVLLAWEGVLWQRGRVDLNAKELLSFFESNQASVAILAPDSPLGPKSHAAEAWRAGMPLSSADFLTPSSLMSGYLGARFRGRAFLVLGWPELQRDLLRSGLQLCSETTDSPVLVLGTGPVLETEEQRAAQFLSQGSPMVIQRYGQPHVRTFAGEDEAQLRHRLIELRPKSAVVPNLLTNVLGATFGAHSSSVVFVARGTTEERELAAAASLSSMWLSLPQSAEGPVDLRDFLDRQSSLESRMVAAWNRAGESEERYF